MPEIVQRPVDEAAAARLAGEGLAPRLARIFAARGVASAAELSPRFEGLLPPSGLARVDEAARLLADAIAAGQRILVVADYDADGATACAVALRALRAFGAKADFIVPDRFRFGYGLTPEIVRLAAERKPDLLVTVDNGIASVEGVTEAKRLGIDVLVTDHHLPGRELPEAACIVNPNQAGCGFASKHLAGVGVIFYTMSALRAELRRRGALPGGGPNLAALLDLVALGTVADVVKLDANNRILVAQGLARIRAEGASEGVKALFTVAGRDARRASAYDLGFVAGPRLNAAGRMEDMSIGIECLLTDDAGVALELAGRLDKLNHERQEVEAGMQETALALLADFDPGESWSIAVHRPDWHAGVVGILASRLKDRFHRPVFAFANDAGGGDLKGSGRSIPGLHLRDALDLVAKREPGVITRFGGHAAAAGASVPADRLPDFQRAFEGVVREALSPADLERRIETDGELPAEEIAFDLAAELKRHVWGQGFPEPRFASRLRVLDQRIVGGKHTKLTLGAGSRRIAAIHFNETATFPAEIDAIYRLDVNEWNGTTSLQLVVEHWS
jgi:single-stranded-DNA-specific exonuclease